MRELEGLAVACMTGRVVTNMLPPAGYEWRKGKGIPEFQEAFRLGIRAAHRANLYKTEAEIDMVEVQLHGVFKKARKIRQ